MKSTTHSFKRDKNAWYIGPQDFRYSTTYQGKKNRKLSFNPSVEPPPSHVSTQQALNNNRNSKSSHYTTVTNSLLLYYRPDLSEPANRSCRPQHADIHLEALRSTTKLNNTTNNHPTTILTQKPYRKIDESITVTVYLKKNQKRTGVPAGKTEIISSWVAVLWCRALHQSSYSIVRLVIW